MHVTFLSSNLLYNFTLRIKRIINSKTSVRFSLCFCLYFIFFLFLPIWQQRGSQAAMYIKGNKIKSNQMKCAYVWRFMSCAPLCRITRRPKRTKRKQAARLVRLLRQLGGERIKARVGHKKILAGTTATYPNSCVCVSQLSCTL